MPLIVVDGTVDGHTCTKRILLDGGATTSFISSEFVQAAGLSVTNSRHIFRVEMANGAWMTCDKMVQQVQLKVHSTTSSCDIKHDLIVMPCLPKYDMILGRSFLHQSSCVIDHGKNVVDWRGNESVETLQPKNNTGVNHQQESSYDETIYLHHLMVSLSEQHMGEGVNNEYLGAMVGSVEERARLEEIVNDYKKKMEPYANQLPPDRGEYNHSIRLKDPNMKPIKRPAIPLKPMQARKMKEKLDELLKLGFIRRSQSSWGAPAFMVDKDGGKDMRMVIDYTALNKHVIKNATSLPHIKELVMRLNNAKVFSKLDLKSGYHQILMQLLDVEKTAFTTPFGHYEWLVMPFGECNSPATFVQFLSQKVFGDMSYAFIIIFVDDILVFSDNAEDHLIHVQAVLDRLAEHHLFINPDKCKWMVDEVSFLGYHLKAGNGGAMMMAQPHRVEAIKNWPTPKTVKDVQSFIGVANFCRMFVKNFADIAKPLTDLMGGKRKQNEMVQWTDEHERAFNALKDALSSAPALAIPDDSKPFTLFTDASDFGVGAMLCQKNETTGTLQPCGFMSAKLSGPMLNWSTFDKECWALIAALDYWSMLLHGAQEIQVFTDHRALQYILNHPHLNGRQARWIEFLRRFNISIKYMKGEENVEADALSRRPDLDGGQEEVQRVRRLAADATLKDLGLNSMLCNIGAIIAVDELTKMIIGAYQSDPKCFKMIESPEKYRVHLSGGVLLNSKGRIIVPNNPEIKKLIISELHDGKTAGHLGSGKTVVRVTDRFWWPGMVVDIIKYVAQCDSCQRNKDSTKPPMGYLQSLEAPMNKGQVITVDFVGPLPRTSRQHDFVMVITDGCTKRVWYHACTQKITAKQAARVIFDKVVTHQGLPEVIVSDRDPRFTSAVWQNLWAECGTKLAMSSSFHPQANGQTEQHNKVMQEMLRAYVNAVGSDWDVHLSALEMAYNSSRHASTGFTPYELDIGFNPVVPIDIATRVNHSKEFPNVVDFFNNWTARWSKAQDNVVRAQLRQQRAVNKHRRPNEIEAGDLVLLQINRGPQRQSIGPATKFGPRMEGPYRVKRVTGPNNVELQLDSGDERHPVVNVSQLRKFISNPIDIHDTSANPESASINEDSQSNLTQHESGDNLLIPRIGLRQRKARDLGPYVY